MASIRNALDLDQALVQHSRTGRAVARDVQTMHTIREVPSVGMVGVKAVFPCMDSHAILRWISLVVLQEWLLCIIIVYHAGPARLVVARA